MGCGSSTDVRNTAPAAMGLSGPSGPSGPPTPRALRTVEALDGRDAAMLLPPNTWVPVFNKAASREAIVGSFDMVSNNVRMLDFAFSRTLLYMAVVPCSNVTSTPAASIAGCVAFAQTPSMPPTMVGFVFTSRAAAQAARHKHMGEGPWGFNVPIKAFRADHLYLVCKRLQQEQRRLIGGCPAAHSSSLGSGPTAIDTLYA